MEKSANCSFNRVFVHHGPKTRTDKIINGPSARRIIIEEDKAVGVGSDGADWSVFPLDHIPPIGS